MSFSRYESAKNQLIQALAVLDTHVDGVNRPQGILSAFDWTELEASPGVFVKNISLHKPSSFAIVLVHGIKGASEKKHHISDKIELHCISGKVMMNGFEFKSGDRITIPENTEYEFMYLEDSYMTVKFIPKNKDNYIYHGSNLPATN